MSALKIGRWAWLVAVALACGRRGEPPGRRARAPEPAPSAVAAPAEPEPLDQDEPPAGEAAGGPAKTVTIKLVADARRGAHVFWGRKDLGAAPLAIQRPQGSGPLDLTVTAPGFLPLHTRAFTDRDETLALRLYTEADARGLLGYRPPEAKANEAKANPQTARPSRTNKPRRPF